MSLELKLSVGDGRRSYKRKRGLVTPVEPPICYASGREGLERDCLKSADGSDGGVGYESPFEAAVERIIRSIDRDLGNL